MRARSNRNKSGPECSETKEEKKRRKAFPRIFLQKELNSGKISEPKIPNFKIEFSNLPIFINALAGLADRNDRIRTCDAAADTSIQL